MKMPTTSFFCATLFCVGAFLFSVSAQAAKPDQSFVKNATIGNQFEISSSQLALQNSQNDQVRSFAQHMIDDHTQVGNQLKSVLSTSNVSVKQPRNNLDSKHRKMLDVLRDMKGTDFDKEYMRDQVAAHNEAVSLFQTYASSGGNDALKAFAQHALPTLQEHQQAVNTLQTSL